MAEPAATASPLAAVELPRVPAVAILTEVPIEARLSVRAAPAAAAALGASVGLDLAARINTASLTTDGGLAALRLGPDEWLLLARRMTAQALAEQVAAASAPADHAIIDVSHRTASLELAGPEVEAVLAAGCPLPLDADAFPAGRATRTLVGKAEVVLWRLATDRFHIEVARSFAPYLTGLLQDTISAEAVIAGLRRT